MVKHKEPKSKFKKIGTVGIESGVIIVGDAIGVVSNGQYVIDHLAGMGNEKDHICFGSNEKEWESMVAAHTGFGDGIYDVIAEIVDFGKGGKRIASLTIDFMSDNGQFKPVPMKKVNKKTLEALK